MTVNSTLAHVSKDIVWVYTLLEHYTVILSLWVGGFTRINTICLVQKKKKRISRCLFFRCFSLFSVEKLLTRRLNGDGSGLKSLCKDKAKQTKWNTQIYAHLFFLGDSYFSPPRPKWKTSRVKRCVGPFSVWQNQRILFLFFLFLWEISEQPSMNDELRRRLCLAGWFLSLLLLLAFIPLGVTIHTSESEITF